MTLFCVVTASLMVILRLGFFDYRNFFTYKYLPNHDMCQNASMFATSMHSMRLHGDLAWWNPISNNGYAQYFQAFLSPLAPTNGNIVFIVWAQFAWALGRIGIEIPEYLQYLIVTYIVLPFLAFLAFSTFCAAFFRRRSTIFITTFVYSFSGIGLWNSSWFYFQEPFTLFLFLGSLLHAARRPTVRGLLALLVATLIQIASCNYWTIYNFFFIAIVLGGYCWAYPHRIRRLCHFTAESIHRRWIAAALTIGASSVVAIMWVTILASVVREQSGSYVRPSRDYSISSARDRVQAVRWFTTEFFNPEIRRPLKSYKILNPMHNARYVGASLIPLLVVLPLYRWRRLERWLTFCAAGILVVCLAPPYLLAVWSFIPGMNRIQHEFYFYTHHLQLYLVLLAGASMEFLHREGLDAATRSRIARGILALLFVVVLMLLAFGALAESFEANDPGLQGNLLFALLCLASGFPLLQSTIYGGQSRALWLIIMLAITTADLSRYYFECCIFDRTFTMKRWDQSAETLPGWVQAALRKPWNDPDPSRGFEGGLLGNLPIRNNFWPKNEFVIPRALAAILPYPKVLRESLTGGQPVQYFRRAEPVTDSGLLASELARDPARLGEVLWIHGNPGPSIRPPDVASSPDALGLSYQFREWRYNGFRIVVDVPAAGWLLIRQLYDPAWRISVDGRMVPARSADFVAIAIPVAEGSQEIRMDYRPTSRRLYWPACLMLESVLLALIIGIFRSPGKTKPNRSGVSR